MVKPPLRRVRRGGSEVWEIHAVRRRKVCRHAPAWQGGSICSNYSLSGQSGNGVGRPSRRHRLRIGIVTRGGTCGSGRNDRSGRPGCGDAARVRKRYPPGFFMARLCKINTAPIEIRA